MESRRRCHGEFRRARQCRWSAFVQDRSPLLIGYDNAHGRHHRRYKGKVESVEFTSFENIEDRFEADWTAFRRRSTK